MKHSMKNSKNLITLGISSLFLLSACATSSVSPSQEARQRGPTTEPTPGASLYAQGLTCDLLQTANQKEQCESRVNDVVGALLEEEVISRFDIDRCKKLEDKIGINCQNVLANINVQGPVSDDEMAIFSQAISGNLPEPREPGETFDPHSQVRTFDLGTCSQLTTPGYKEFCESQLTQLMEQEKFNDILSSGNSTRCAELSGDVQDQCEVFFGLAEEPQPNTLDPASLPAEPPTPEAG